ncbi:MAG: DUF3899 domain-containing protein [Candidatus Onthovivens sp.]|nr:DUF3899 domain-containing protein [Candidatus Onthovivens sp.]
MLKNVKVHLNNFLSNYNFKKQGLVLLVLALFGVGFTLFIYFIKQRSIIDGCNGSFGAFAIFFFIGSYQIILNQGTFDALGYSVTNMISSWGKGAKRKYKDLIDYKDRKAQSRKTNKFNFIAYYIASFIFLITAIILFIIYKCTF